MEHTESDTNTPRADGGETNHTTSEDEADETTGPIEFNVTIEDGTTVIEMDGDRDTAVIVQSASGERVYLPPEDFERAAPTAQRNESPYQSSGTNSPYQSAATDSPYQSAATDSPYQSSGTDSPYQSTQPQSDEEGLVSTTEGYRIYHPEPATDVRVLR
ncbi:MAG: hypothetical protein J07HQW1_02395 [Haloquadratum walsbyi J07HQW1]|jgi:hypothetical protein|uniref:Uncharacterized protein n=1 Tax=Haloquadratum walsbyi J07HQW1 TaxID=1238424 RepID=U1N7C8_9EURY|nr:MAG: hypothetical protein J07HQW1_02395 [Haloquadratum walsbyi J07HQW1]